MLGNLIRLIIIVAILALVISIFPITYTWFTTALEWIMAQGKWGTIILTACIIHAVLGDLL